MKKVLSILLVIATLLIVMSCELPHTHTVSGELIVVKEATCGEMGAAYMFCTDCGQIVNTISIPKTNKHNSDIVIPAIDSTCTEKGRSEGRACSICGHIMLPQQETPISAHIYDDKYDETCNECGFIRDAECAHRETETIKGYNATCISTGLTDGLKCKNCEEIIVYQTKIQKTDHTCNGEVCVVCGRACDEDCVHHEIRLWVSTTAGVKEFTELKIAAFKEAHPEYKFNIKVETVGEGDAAAEVLKDVATAPDMYCFAQDQISRLVQGGALAPLGVQATATVKAENDSGSVGAATVGGTVYAYPLTSDNGYYLYYDSSVVSDEQAKTLDGIVEACRAAGKKFGYNLTNPWIMAGFFFAQPVGGGDALCSSTWTYSADGKNAIAVDDNFNSANGLIAMKAMNALANSGSWVDSADNFGGTGAIVTGIWNANPAEAEYGDNMKATKLPTYTVDGTTYQMGSFSGYKLLGCKPQTDDTKAKICADLALYLTSSEAQLERYYEFRWGPSNKTAQANQDVQGNVLLAALLQQNEFAVPQGVIHWGWWDEAALLGAKCAETDLTESDLLAALATYEEKINAMIIK